MAGTALPTPSTALLLMYLQLMATVVAYCHTLNSTRTDQLIADHLQFLTVPGKQNNCNWNSRLCLTIFP